MTSKWSLARLCDVCYRGLRWSVEAKSRSIAWQVPCDVCGVKCDHPTLCSILTTALDAAKERKHQ